MLTIVNIAGILTKVNIRPTLTILELTPSKESTVICLDSIDITIKGYSFRSYYYVIILISLFTGGVKYNLYIDTGIMASLINKGFLL